MEPDFQLTPESARALAVRLFTKEQFAANPRACILKALDWLDAAVGDSAAESPRSATSARSALVERLDQLAKAQGLETVAGAIGVSHQAIRSWLRGVEPNSVNLEKIKRYLETETSPAGAVGIEQPAERGGELFGQQQPPAG